MLNNIIKRFTVISCALAAELTRLAKFSFIIGSKGAFFSPAQSFSPLVGFFGGVTSSIAIFSARIIITGLFSGLSAYITSLYHIPTFCGALYLSTNSKIVRIGIPLVCMALFIAHPIGSQAYLYSCYWLIPIGIALLNRRSVFMQALGSTFTTHAVGSVIWLYTHSLSSSSWNMLIGIVWAERLLLAAAMTALYYAITYLQDFITKKIGARKALLAFSASNI